MLFSFSVVTYYYQTIQFFAASDKALSYLKLPDKSVDH